jgi:hypothetical protein
VLQLPINPKFARFVIPFFLLLGFVLFAIVQWLKILGIADETDEIFIPAFGTLGLFCAYCFVVSIIALRQPASRFLLSEDLSSDPDPSPIEGKELGNVIESLGFSQIGKFGRDGIVQTWMYLDKQSEVMLLVNQTGVPQIYSIFEDGFLDFTNPSNYKHPMPPSTPILEQYTNAYSAHQNGLKSKLEKHGKVMIIEGIETWLAFEKQYGYQQVRKTSLLQAKWWGGFTAMIASVWIMALGQEANLPKEIQSIIDWLPLASFGWILYVAISNGLFAVKFADYSAKKSE